MVNVDENVTLVQGRNYPRKYNLDNIAGDQIISVNILLFFLLIHLELCSTILRTALSWSIKLNNAN